MCDHLQWRVVSLRGHEASKRVVITLHGIRTFAPWQKDLADELGKAGFNTKSLQYGYFGALKLVSHTHRKKQIDWFRDQYTLIQKEYPDTVPSIIAHSFGTYIVARALEMFDGIKFDQVILCGSIIPQGFDWQELFNSGQVRRVLNECAQKDIVVKSSPFFIQDAGPSGVYGFNQNDNIHLYQRFISKFGHSDYLHVLNFSENWIPFLKGGYTPKDRPTLNEEVNWRYWLTRIILLLLLTGLAIAGFIVKEGRRNLPTSSAQTSTEQSQEAGDQNINGPGVSSYTPTKQGKQPPANSNRTRSVAFYLDQARKLSRQGDYEGAIRACNKALKIDPKNSLAKIIRDEAIFADEHYNSKDKKQ